MNDIQINNVTDLHQQISQCVDERDIEKLEGIREYIHGWMQLEDELVGQVLMIDSILELLYESE